MKKVLLGVFVLCALLTVATGCEKKNNENNASGNETTTVADKKLNCSIAANGETTRINVTYEGGKIAKTTWTETKKYGSDKEAKKAYEDGQKDVKEINSHKGISGSISYSGTSYTSSLTFTIDKFDDYAKEQYEELFKEIKDKSYDENKEALTKAGYDCK